MQDWRKKWKAAENKPQIYPLYMTVKGRAFLSGGRYVIIKEMRLLRKMIGVPICNPLERLLERFE
jgi:hypothetical protein